MMVKIMMNLWKNLMDIFLKDSNHNIFSVKEILEKVTILIIINNDAVGWSANLNIDNKSFWENKYDKSWFIYHSRNKHKNINFNSSDNISNKIKTNAVSHKWLLSANFSNKTLKKND